MERRSRLDDAAVVEVPGRVVTFKNGTPPDDVYRKVGRAKVLYYGSRRERMQVLRWHRWPCYDFIFAVPLPTNRYYKDEAAYFVYRDARNKKVKSGFYVDSGELKVLRDGFERLYRADVARRRRGRG